MRCLDYTRHDMGGIDATYLSPARIVLFVVSNMRNALERFLDYARNDMEGGIVISTTLDMTWEELMPRTLPKLIFFF